MINYMVKEKKYFMKMVRFQKNNKDSFKMEIMLDNDLIYIFSLMLIFNSNIKIYLK